MALHLRCLPLGLPAWPRGWPRGRVRELEVTRAALRTVAQQPVQSRVPGSEAPRDQQAGRVPERGTRARELQTSGGSALGTFWACPPVHSAADDQGGCRALWEREWVRGGVEARQRGAKQLEERMSGLSAPAGAGAAVPSCAEVEQDCAKSGWVYKQSKHVKKWNKRYFVLWPKEAHPKKGRLLFYYTTPQVQIHTPNAVEPRTRPTSSRIRLSAAHAQPRARRTRSLGGWFH